MVLVDAAGLVLPDYPAPDFFSLSTDQVAELSYYRPDAFRLDLDQMPDQVKALMAGNRAALAGPGQGRGRVLRKMPLMSETLDPRELALRIRLRAVRMVAPQGFGYLGQALSSAEQVAAVFGAARPGVDRIVCSPGHYIIGPFAAAAELGLADVSGYGQNGSVFEAIGTERSPVVDYTCGSLGQGLSAALGFALADRFRGSDARVFAMVSDGELEEGQVWEAALFAAHHRLDRLVVLLDANNSQVDGPVDSITTLEPIADKWSAFGWQAFDIDGHDVAAVSAALVAAGAERERPSVLVCRTSTRHGLDCLPPDADGHFIKLPPSLVAAAVAELTGKLEALRA